MRKLLFIVVFVSFLSTAFASLDADWRKLHEEADRISLETALLRLQENPDSLNELYILGLVYFNLHKDREAMQVFDKIIAMSPDKIEAQWGRAEALRRIHELSESEKILKKVIKNNPDFSPAYISLAYIKYIKMDFEMSVSLAKTVIRQREENVDLSNYARAYAMFAGAKGMIAHYGGPFSKAINGTQVLSNLKRAEKLQPNSPAVLFGLGSFYLLAPTIAGGNLERAEEYLKKGIKIDPLFTDIYVRLAQLYKLKGDNKKYEVYLKEALEIDPENELALDVKSGKCKYICVETKEN